MPGEGGLIACTWPRGGQEVLKYGKSNFANYNNECQNGYEYAATSLMMWAGMPYESLAHIWYMNNNRYVGSKRNPWCEVEWGIHYSRSMASYGHFIAVCGFEYNGPDGYMAFSPKITPRKFKAPFTSAEGWGTFSQIKDGKRQIDIIRVVHGKLKLKSLAFDLVNQKKIKNVFISNADYKYKFSQKGKRIEITFEDKICLNSEKELKVIF